MIPFATKRPLTGFEVTASSLKMVQVMRDKRVWRLVNFANIPLPEGVLNLSFSDRNILDISLFHYTIGEAVKLAGNKVPRAGLSLPNETVKLSIQRFEEVPESRAKREQLLAWREKETLPFPLDRAKISYAPTGQQSGTAKDFLVTIGFKDVIREYEMAFKHFQIDPVVVRPSGINHLNFYSEKFSESGVFAFHGIFATHFTFFVFENERLLFYRGKRRPFPMDRFLDIALDLFRAEYPEKKIHTVYFGTEKELLEIDHQNLEDEFDLTFLNIEETGIISLNPGLEHEDGTVLDIAPLASAIGAAQSLTH